MSGAAAAGSSASAGDDQLTQLAKRKAMDKGATAPRVGRWIHQVGEETMDTSLSVYYCAVCGAHSLILDALLSELPKRSSDGARVVQLSKHECKLLLDEGPCVRIKRTPSLVETQYRYTCKSCALPLAYLSRPFNDKTNRLLYLVDDAFSLRDAGLTPSQLSEKEKEAREAEPIVIPVFDVQKANHSSSSSSAKATAAPTAEDAIAAKSAAPASSSSSSAAAASAPAASSSSSAAAAAAAPADSSSAGAAAATPATKQ